MVLLSGRECYFGIQNTMNLYSWRHRTAIWLAMVDAQLQYPADASKAIEQLEARRVHAGGVISFAAGQVYRMRTDLLEVQTRMAQ